MPIKAVPVPPPEKSAEEEPPTSDPTPEGDGKQEEQAIPKVTRRRRTAAEVAHDKAEKEAARAQRAVRKQEQEAAKAERAAKKEAREQLTEEQEAAKEHKEPCNVCRKTVSLPDHTCKKEDLAALPKKPTAEETFPTQPTAPAYSPGDSDEEPLSYRELLQARQYERQRSAVMAQLRPMQAWYAGRLR